MMRRHHNWQGELLELPVGKVVCVGRNYLDHVKELDNEVPEEALLFMKPSTAVCDIREPVRIPTRQGQCHNELEVAVLIGRQLARAEQSDVMRSVWGYGLALDLTLREVQSRLKARGHPWERAKAFDGSCPVSGFVPAKYVARPQALDFSLRVNGNIRQKGNTAQMMRTIAELLSEISQSFTLLPGDIVLTGTPEGVSALEPGDKLELSLGDTHHLSTEVKAND